MLYLLTYPFSRDMPLARGVLRRYLLFTIGPSQYDNAAYYVLCEPLTGTTLWGLHPFTTGPLVFGTTCDSLYISAVFRSGCCHTTCCIHFFNRFLPCLRNVPSTASFHDFVVMEVPDCGGILPEQVHTHRGDVELCP